MSLADTGLAYTSCFFNMSTAPSATFAPAATVVVYPVAGGDTTDATGHGTAMAGLIAGDPTGPQSQVRQSPLTHIHTHTHTHTLTRCQFRGLAPQAKIAFTDISTGSSGAYTGPADIIAYMDAARTQWSSSILVGAFGSTAPVTWYARRSIRDHRHSRSLPRA